MDLYLPIILTCIAIIVTIIVMLIEKKWLKLFLAVITIGLFISLSIWIITEILQNKKLQQDITLLKVELNKLKDEFKKLKDEKDKIEAKYNTAIINSSKNKLETRQRPKADTTHSSPMIIEPKWVNEGESEQIIPGKLLITLYMNSFSYGYTTHKIDNYCSDDYKARAVIKSPNNEERILCLNSNDIKQFLFENKIYLINLLGIRSDQRKKLVKKSSPSVYGGPEHEEVPYDINTFKISISIKQ